MIAAPYLLFLGDRESSLYTKTAQGLVRWRPELCLGQTALEDSDADVGLDSVSIAEAAAAGAKTMVIGVANVGGYIPAVWVPPIVEALRSGLDVASGLHTRLDSIDEIRLAASAAGRRLWDVRHADREFDPGTGEPRSGRRLLAVGSDCDVGKMFSALAIEAEMKRRGWKTDFRASGQTGILIAGRGVSVDAVISDFVSGAAEWLSPANDDDHWDLIEGQGALHHPAYAGVTLGLIHGSQPHALVVCHEAGRERLHGFPAYPTPPLDECIAVNVAAARITNPGAICVGICVNTSKLDVGERARYLGALEDEHGLPCVDPLATGTAAIVDHVERLQEETW